MSPRPRDREDQEREPGDDPRDQEPRDQEPRDQEPRDRGEDGTDGSRSEERADEGDLAQTCARLGVLALACGALVLGLALLALSRRRRV